MKNPGVLFLSILSILVAGNVHAETKTFALVLGNNSPPPDSSLETLKFADDDAVRFFRFFSHFTEMTRLMTLPDARTQSRYPEISTRAVLPTPENLKREITRISRKVHAAKQAGHEVVFYMTFSGHGDHDNNGDAYLSLIGGKISHQVLYDAITEINADYTHLFVDACHAGGVVGFRGQFDNETSGKRIRLSEDDINKIMGPARDSLPGFGTVIASSDNGVTHEWSTIESGIFTHEVISGLSGAADVNGDGKIEYSEIVAFVSSANRNVSDIRNRMKIIGSPPPRNRNVPIVDLSTFARVAFLTGNPSTLGHFFIELDHGERYLDAHLEDKTRMNVAIPAGRVAYVYANDQYARVNTESGDSINVNELHYSKEKLTDRGRLNEDLQKGLFLNEYGKRYYNGFIDSVALTSVRFDARPMLLPASLQDDSDTGSKKNNRVVAGKTTLIFAAAALGGAVVSGILAARAKKAFDRTNYHRESLSARDDYERYSGLFWGGLGITALGIAVGSALIRRGNRNRKKGNSFRAGFAVGQNDTALFYYRF